MTILKERPNTALVVVDMQIGVVRDAADIDAVVAKIVELVGKARQEGVPVIWVRHSDEDLVKGSDDWSFVPGLIPDEIEPVVEKRYPDSFEDTNLEALLSNIGVGKLVVVGAQTDACILSTLHGAFVRGYDATLIGDAHTTIDQTAGGAPPPRQIIAQANFYWAGQTAPGRKAGTANTLDFSFFR